MDNKSNQTSIRKEEHLEIFRNESSTQKHSTTWLEHVHFVHMALTDINFGEIDISNYFAQHKFETPFFITAITGGTDKALDINIALAKVAEKFGMGFGVGSQRAMLEYPELISTYDVKRHAPDVFLAGNIGMAQIKHWSVNDISQMISDIKADALCIHLNQAQEMLQPEGDRDFSHVLENILKLRLEIKVPLIVKEVGCGISREIAQQLSDNNIRYLDCAGVGGTNWQSIELIRSGKQEDEDKSAFLDWGVPTAASCMEINGTRTEFIASGGITNGLEAAKTLSLGASMAGFASVALKAYFEGGEQAVAAKVESMIYGLKTAMLLTSSKTISDLKRASKIISGELKTWCESRGIPI